MNRMNMTANERSKLAEENMRSVLEEKYGPNYWELMTTKHITPEML